MWQKWPHLRSHMFDLGSFREYVKTVLAWGFDNWYGASSSGTLPSWFKSVVQIMALWPKMVQP